ncbi:MAG TPA: hypothetical protein VMF88_10750 [Bacteroidota bacterium]|nr:hypothetical protein [Bacteroidota bacterium]
MQSPWNSLELIKILVDVLTPLLLLLLGIWVNRIAKRIEATQWTNQKVVEKRIIVYDELAPLLNDMYCYYEFVGNWKELTPVQIIETKRKLDEKVHIYAPLFSPSFISSFKKFEDLCFQTFVGAGLDAKLRTPIKSSDGDRRQSSKVHWESKWQTLFSSPSNCSDPIDIHDAYQSLMGTFSKELGIGLNTSKSAMTNKQE